MAVIENDRKGRGEAVSRRSEDSKERRIRRENTVEEGVSNFDFEQATHASFNK